MDEFILRFKDILTEEKNIHNQLVALSKEKKEAILDNSIPRLDKIVAQEHALISRVSQYEKSRQRCVHEFSSFVGLPVQEVDFTAIRERAPERMWAELEALHSEMRSQLVELKELNDVNKKLIESRLDYVQFSVDAMTGIGNSQVYGSGGGDAPQTKPQAPRIYDRKV